MTLHLWFRDQLRETIDWPSAPPVFKKPWREPVSVKSISELSNIPNTQYVEYKLKSVLGEDAYYYATYKDLIS